MRPRRTVWSLLPCWALASFALASCAEGVLTDDTALDASYGGDDAPLVVEDAGAVTEDAVAALDAPPTDDVPGVVDVAVIPDAGSPTDAPPVTDSGSGRDVPRAVDVPPVVDVPACPSGASLCAGRCTSTRTDPAHCGACGRACAAGEACTDGTCAVPCAGTTTRCETACVDLARDLANCGSCGHRCEAAPGATAACNAGRCGVGCGAGRGDCNGSTADGCEVELATSATNCGACGRACAAGQTCVAGACTTPAIEGFESGTWPWAPWTLAGGNRDWSATAACAHDGARGLAGPDGGSRWYYRTDRTVGASGERLSAWFRATTALGRGYLGFGASAAGAWSFVFAPNTRQVAFFRHTTWGFAQITASTAALAADTWYRAEVTFGASGMVTGRLYTEAGATIATLTTTIAGLPTGGVALYAFNACVDTIEVR